MWQELLGANTKIRRIVRHTETGVEAVTESDDPAVAAKIIEHAKATVHEARSLEQLRASGKRPPRENTFPSGPPDPKAKPTGPRHEVNSRHTQEHQESIIGEQEVMDAAAQKGFKAEWLPEGNAKSPDCKLEGRIFDVYTPRQSTTTQVLSGVMRKIRDTQTERVVVNLRFRSVSTDALIAELESIARPGLREVMLWVDEEFIFVRLPRE